MTPPPRRLCKTLPIASLTSGSARIVLVTNHSLTFPRSSPMPCSSPTKGLISSCRSRPTSPSRPPIIFSNLPICCSSTVFRLGGCLGALGSWKTGPSWVRAMKKEKTVLRARMMSWNGSSGGWVVRFVRKGLMKERIGVVGLVRVCVSSRSRNAKQR